MDKVTNRPGRDKIVRTLKHQRWHLETREISSVVGEKCRLRESSRDDRICRAKALGELRSQFGSIGVLHHDRTKEIRPADVVLLHCLEQAFDIGALETADVRRVVDVTR